MDKKQSEIIPIRKKVIYIVSACVMGLVLLLGILITLSFAYSHDYEIYLMMVITIIGMLFAMILFVCCWYNIRDNTQQGNTLALISVLLYFDILLSGIIDTLYGTILSGSALFTLQTLTAILSTCVHFLFWRYQCASLPETRSRRYFTIVIYSISLLYFIVLAINPFTGILFKVDASGQMTYSGETIELIFISLFYITYLSYIIPQRCTVKKKLSLASFAVFPLLCIVLTAIWYGFGIRYAVSSLTFIFLLMAAYVVYFGDYIENKELLLQQKAELAEQAKKQTELQTALMLSQIRPHFLYNALTAIRYLCKNNPAEAYTAIGQFADYLRGNMDSLGGGRMTPFEKELEHVKTYLMLEQMRFGDELKVEYDIRYQDFSLPALTLQPIVENAVRHGATLNEQGGRITITSEKTDTGAVITVTDNGPGFDPEAPIADGRSHFGLENVRKCLAALSCGEIMIESTPGKGTNVTINIWEGKG